MASYVHSISFVVADGAVHNGVQNMVHVDMNDGSKGKYIYPVVHYTQKREDAISGWYFVQNDQSTPPHYTKINQDLNDCAGGTYNYLCYTKVGEPKMKQVSFVALNDGYGSDTYNGWKVYRQDLNTGARRAGGYVYLLYKTETPHEINLEKARRLEQQRETERRIQRRINAVKVQQLKLRKHEMVRQKAHIIADEFNIIHQQRVDIESKISSEESEIRTFTEERSDESNQLILLFGNTGHGKSTLGNRLMGDQSLFANETGPYKTSYDNGSCTTQLQKSKRNKLSIVDCPGWNDSEGNDRSNINNLCSFLRGCGGVNGFVLVRKVGKFDSDFKQKLQYVEHVFGDGFWTHLVIVLTHVDKGMSELQYRNSNKEKQIKDDISLLSGGRNSDVAVVAIGLDNYEDKLQMFMDVIPSQKYVCDKIKSPIHDLRRQKEIILHRETQIQQRIASLDSKINDIENEISALSV